MRLSVSLLLAAAINLSLFWAMLMMVSADWAGNRDSGYAQLVEFVRVKPRQDPPPEMRRRKPPPRKPPRRAPEKTIKVQGPRPRIKPHTPLPVPAHSLKLDLPLRAGTGPYLGPVLADPGDGLDVPLATGLIPIVQFPPQYPPAARMKRLKGFVEIEFTVTREGRVKNAKVIDSRPSGVFDRAALRAIRFWRFKPELKDGDPVAVRALQRIDFSLEQR